MSDVPRTVRLRSFVLFFLLAGALLTVAQLAANVLALACGWVLFLALLLVAAIVLTYDGRGSRKSETRFAVSGAVGF